MLLAFIPGMSRLAALHYLSPPGNALPNTVLPATFFPTQFVIVASFDHTDPDLEVKNRVAQAMERCGLSIACEE